MPTKEQLENYVEFLAESLSGVFSHANSLNKEDLMDEIFAMDEETLLNALIEKCSYLSANKGASDWLVDSFREGHMGRALSDSQKQQVLTVVGKHISHNVVAPAMFVSIATDRLGGLNKEQILANQENMTTNGREKLIAELGQIGFSEAEAGAMYDAFKSGKKEEIKAALLSKLSTLL